jgi:CHAT domain-containing protein/tetratricopeptide (TPR) repeat protein
MRHAGAVCLTMLLLVVPQANSQIKPGIDWDKLTRQVDELYAKGDLREAIRIAAIARDVASTPVQSGHSLDRLGFLYYTSGDLKTGETFLRQSLDLRGSKLGTGTLDYAESANDLALALRDSRQLQEARALAEQSAAIRAAILNPNDPLVAESLNTLGTVHAFEGQYDLATSKFEQALHIQESYLDLAHPSEEYGTLCVNMAGTYQRLGKYAKAETLFRKALDALRKNPGVNHPAYSSGLGAFAYLQMDLGNYAAAEKLYSEAEPLMRQQLGEQHPLYATVLNNRGFLYFLMGNRSAAESDYRKALDLYKRTYGPDSAALRGPLRNLARLVYDRNPEEGEKLFREALNLYAMSPNRPAFDYASTLIGLGEAQQNRGSNTAARRTLEQALQVAEEGLGAKHPLYAHVLADLALVDQFAGEYPKAEQRLREAIAIVGETHGENNPELSRYLELLAKLFTERGDYAAAEPLYRSSFDIGDRFLTEVLNIGSEGNKLAYLANLEDPIPALLSFQKKAGDRIPEARALAFEAIARRKGRVLDQVRDWRQRIRGDSNSSVRSNFQEWDAILECQSSLTIGLGYRDLRTAVGGGCELPGTEFEGRYEGLLLEVHAKWTPALAKQALDALGTLKLRSGVLEAALSREVPDFGSTLRPVTLDRIASRLAPDELLLEFVAWQPQEIRGKGQRYGVFLLDRDRNLQWIDLGPAEPIDSAVRDLIKSANDWSFSLAAREKQSAEAARKTANDAIGDLSKQVLTPLEPFLAQKRNLRQLRIAPDGMLTLVPFEALSNRGYVVQRFTTSYVSAGRDLVKPEPGTERSGPPVIIVSPGAGPKRVISRIQATGDFRADRLDRLNEAAQEAQDIRARLPRALLLGEGQATEERVKELHSPALLHIVGHGIVRGNEDCKADPEKPACALGDLDPVERIMSLSAIVLEEAYGRGGRSSEDGLLTALELQALDLRGSQMLVLSQCRMADGVPSSAEGVHGMRQAAAIAGARTFIAPLWNVSDSTERALIGKFYEELSAGQGRAEALRRAKLWLLKKPATDSFLYWAPIILSGDPAPLPRELFQP